MTKYPTRKMRGRMTVVLGALILFGFTVLIGRLFTIQIVKADFYQSKALGQQLKTTAIHAERGNIYDRNGKTLARSASVWNVNISPAEIKTPEEARKLADGLAKILEMDAEKIYKKTQNRASYYEVVKRKVEKPVVDEIRAFLVDSKLDGVHFEENNRRYYPYGNFASTIIGFTGDENKGAYGIEAYYDRVLAGTNGRVVSLKNGVGTDMPRNYEQVYDAKDGNSLVLTIDEVIQHFLEKHLETAVVEHNVKDRAVGIVMNVNTGEILAMSTKPDFDPNDPLTIYDEEQKLLLEEQKKTMTDDEYSKALSNAQFAQWRNKAISDPYEPGSVFKIITSAAGLESGAVHANDPFMCNGYLNVAGNRIDCWKAGGHGPQTFEQGIMNSCNPVFMTVGQNMGVETFYSYFENFGLTKPTGIDIPGEAEGIYHQKKNMGIAELSSSAFGQTFKVTPLQLITAVSAAVNGGNLMQPYVVKQVVDAEGKVVSSKEPVVKRQVISEEISDELSLMLEKVVTKGSGKQAYIPGYRIGGKTGTSEKLDAKENGVVTKRISSFLGFAPVDDPQIAVLVLFDDPHMDNVYGSVIVAPVVGAIMSDIMPYLGIEPQYTEEELSSAPMKTPYLVGYKPHEAQSELTQIGLKTRLVGSGPTVIKQIPGVAEPITRGGTVILYTDETEAEKKVVVPDVVGMTGQQANRTILNMGLNIMIAGAGIENGGNIAVSQVPEAGTEVDLGQVITVDFVVNDKVE